MDLLRGFEQLKAKNANVSFMIFQDVLSGTDGLVGLPSTQFIRRVTIHLIYCAVKQRRQEKIPKLKNRAQSGSDSPPQSQGVDSIAPDKVGLGLVTMGLKLRGLLGLSESRTLLVRTFLVAPKQEYCGRGAQNVNKIRTADTYAIKQSRRSEVRKLYPKS